jgi:hypothetical protein
MREVSEGFGTQSAAVPAQRIRLAAPVPAIVVEWPTGVFYGNYAICPCCTPSEAEGFVVYLATHWRLAMDWRRLCTATESEALEFISKAQQWAVHGIRDLTFHTDPRNRYCWHRCSFILELRLPSMAFPVIENGWFQGWLAWPWRESSGYEPRRWRGIAEGNSMMRQPLSNGCGQDSSKRHA